MSIFIDEEMQLAVKRGAYWLDEHYPDWVSKINLGKLCMNNCHNCVIGQAVGEYYHTIAWAALDGGTGTGWAVEHGFQAPMFYENCGVVTFNERECAYYTDLETLWTNEVSKRL